MTWQVLYNDGEEEWLHLRNERVIWRLPPSEDSSDEGSEELDDEYDLQVCLMRPFVIGSIVTGVCAGKAKSGEAS